MKNRTLILHIIGAFFLFPVHATDIPLDPASDPELAAALAASLNEFENFGNEELADAIAESAAIANAIEDLNRKKYREIRDAQDAAFAAAVAADEARAREAEAREALASAAHAREVEMRTSAAPVAPPVAPPVVSAQQRREMILAATLRRIALEKATEMQSDTPKK